MSKIRILPENLANQIAAGEVIERPASVVKEFVENAVDAGAGRIGVEVEGAGSRLLRVIDDGEGMDQDDMLLCLERHATSKLHSSEELSAIHTLGFRGEAISSIASVSRLTITSRRQDEELGHRAEIRYGQLHKVHEMGCAHGTVMEVRDLFGNVPARRKFLKTARTELYHVEEIIINSALAFPRLGLTYAVNGKNVRSFAAGTDTPEARVKSIMARNLSGPLVGIESRQDDFVLRGYLLPPDECASSAGLRIFVNNRAVRDRMISHAVAEGLHGFLMKGRRPSGALFLQLDPHRVDVNVHPTKQEIRFHRSQDIHHMIVAAVKQAMQTYQQEIQHVVFGRPVVAEQPIALHTEEHKEINGLPATVDRIAPPTPVTKSIADVPLEKKESAALPPLPSLHPVSPPVQVRESTPFSFAKPQERQKRRFRYVGQFMQSYLVCETDDGIAVIDQHAAHERLLFERMKKEYNAMNIPGQALLFPEIIECTPPQVEVLEKYGDEIARLGLTIREFGGESYAIKAVPAILGHLGPLEIINGVFDHYLQRTGKGKGAATRIDDILANMACKAAVKAHDRLLPEEGEALLRRMEEADIFSHCPHGRPVVKTFSEADIKKWFYR